MNIVKTSRILFASLLLVVTFTVVYSNLSVGATTVDEVRNGVNGAGGGGGTNEGSKVTGTIKIITNTLLFIVGVAAVIMIVVAGLRLVTANGDANTVSQAKNTIIYAIIGIVVAALAYAIVNFIINQIT
jgi:ABC-type Fe3+ transport system permease subunit